MVKVRELYSSSKQNNEAGRWGAGGGGGGRGEKSVIYAPWIRKQKNYG